MDIEAIRERIQQGNYLIKSHAVQHALKEGFERQHMIEAVLNGVIIEDYIDDERSLICGKVTLSEASDVYLHIVVEYTDPVFIEFVTAYIPDELQWQKPPFKRRIRRKK